MNTLKNTTSVDTLIIRTATEKDVPGIHAIAVEAYGEDGANPFHYFIHACLMYPDTFYIAENNGQIIGSCAAVIPAYLPDEAWGFNLGVLRKFQGRGISQKLIRAVADSLKPYGVKKLKLLTETHDRVHLLYTRLGFKVTGVRKDISRPGDDKYIMELDLV